MPMEHLPNTTVEDRVRFVPLYDCHKHGIDPNPEAFVTLMVNNMTNSELLSAISEAMEERLQAFERGLVSQYNLNMSRRLG